MTVDRSVPEVHLHIGSELRTTGGGGVYDHVFPASGEVQGPVPLAGPSDIDDAVARRTRRIRRVADMDAVAAARRARPARRPARAAPRRAGPAVGPRQRHDLRHRPLHRHLGRATTPATTPGGPTRSKAASRRRTPTAASSPTRSPEPYGVIGIIITWNGPLVSIGMKVIPALAAGNTVVVKPSELTPYATEHFMTLVERGRHPRRRREHAPRDRRGRRSARAPPARAEDQLHRRADGGAAHPRRLRRDA